MSENVAHHPPDDPPPPPAVGGRLNASGGRHSHVRRGHPAGGALQVGEHPAHQGAQGRAAIAAVRQAVTPDSSGHSRYLLHKKKKIEQFILNLGPARWWLPESRPEHPAPAGGRRGDQARHAEPHDSGHPAEGQCAGGGRRLEAAPSLCGGSGAEQSVYGVRFVYGSVCRRSDDDCDAVPEGRSGGDGRPAYVHGEGRAGGGGAPGSERRGRGGGGAGGALHGRCDRVRGRGAGDPGRRSATCFGKTIYGINCS